MIRTSYFAKYRGDNGVSIALYSPRWWNGPSYRKLAPSPELLDYWKKTHDTEGYIHRYYLEVLDHLDPGGVL